MLNQPSIVPVLRIFDIEKAKAFYLDFLGFQLDWTHKFGDNFPVYMQISRDSYCLHLTEHYGDCSPGALVRLYMSEVENFAQQLRDQQYTYAKPQLEARPWGNLELSVQDPFSNRLVFWKDQSKNN